MKYVKTFVGMFVTAAGDRLPAPFPARVLMYEHGGKYILFSEAARVQGEPGWADDIIVRVPNPPPDLAVGYTFVDSRSRAETSAQQWADKRTTEIVEETFWAVTGRDDEDSRREFLLDKEMRS